MKKNDAKLIVSGLAHAIKQHFTRRSDHDALAQRVENLERQLAALTKS